MATFYTRDHVSIYIKDRRPLDGEAVVLCHGWPLSADSWDGQVMRLAALKVANAVGAWAGSVMIAARYGLLPAVWAGFGLTLLGLLVFALTSRREPQLAPA
ncbi:hypothetical protein [Terrarubrum flagellatum]|uniref:alpha/beta fold hydrolase n=1 Tax=Terrirubrum flagellatum TaxID=2895980 RepID=UPI00314565B0